MKLCPNCGKSLTPGASDCPKCGACFEGNKVVLPLSEVNSDADAVSLGGKALRTLFAPVGFYFSLPTALFSLTLLAGSEMGMSNSAWLIILLIILIISFPWSIFGALYYMTTTGCCGGGHDHWWSLPLYLLTCGFIALGAHVNGSLLLGRYGLFPRSRKSKD